MQRSERNKVIRDFLKGKTIVRVEGYDLSGGIEFVFKDRSRLQVCPGDTDIAAGYVEYYINSSDEAV